MCAGWGFMCLRSPPFPTSTSTLWLQPARWTSGHSCTTGHSLTGSSLWVVHFCMEAGSFDDLKFKMIPIMSSLLCLVYLLFFFFLCINVILLELLICTTLNWTVLWKLCQFLFLLWLQVDKVLSQLKTRGTVKWRQSKYPKLQQSCLMFIRHLAFLSAILGLNVV